MPMRLAVTAFVLCACHAAAPSGPKAPAPVGPLRAGAGQRPLELPIGHSHAGYAQSKKLAGPPPPDDPGSPYASLFPSTRGMQSPPTAKALVLDNGNARVVLAKIDAIFITAILTDRVIALAKDKLGVDLTGQLLLNATHTHAAGCRFSKESVVADLIADEPDPGARHALAHGVDTYSQESVERVAGPIVAAIGDALAALKPAKLGHGVSQDDVSAHDRRCENDWLTGPGDHFKDVTVLRVDDASSGAPIAVLFSYAIHGTVNDSTNRLLSVDAPGHAEYEVERQFDTPMVAMFFQGPAGDASPSTDGDAGSQGMRRAGWKLAQSVKAARDSITSMQSSIALQSADRWSPENHDLLGYKRAEFFADGAVLCQFLYTPPCPGKPIAGGDVSCIGEAQPGKGKYSTRFFAAQIGDLAVLTLPGEPTSAVGHAMQDAAKAEGFTSSLVVGYSQDHEGYILLDDDWLSGGYEPTISFWGWKFARYALGQSQDLLHELITGAALQKHDVVPADTTPLAFTPITPTDSSTPPGEAAPPDATVERLATVRWAWFGGDPGLGTPDVRLQKKGADGAFADVLVNGWIPISNLRGPELPLTLTQTPTFNHARTATAREHRYELQYEPPIDLPAGTYRFHVAGTAKQSGAIAAYAVDSTPFSVVPTTHLTLDGALTVAGGKLVFDATPLYPAQTPVYSTLPAESGWQVGGFRLTDVRFKAPFAPAKTGDAAATLVVQAMDTVATDAFPLAFADRVVERDARDFKPGAGPGLHGEIALRPGHAVLTIAAGAVTDALGNTNGAAASFSTDVP